ncbi:MAG: DUF2442 domain-containing protein [Deinococcales bacterium]
MNPRVKDVAVLESYQLKLEFNNGEIKVYDCTPLLDFGVFKELKNVHYFNLAKVLDGTVAWPHGQDICPDTLYLDSTKDTEPATNEGSYERQTFSHTPW